MKYEEYKKRILETDVGVREKYFKQDLRFETSHLITIARLEKGLTQDQLASLIGTEQSSIARAESGRTYPTLGFLEKIAVAIGTYLIPPKFGFMVVTPQIDFKFHAPVGSIPSPYMS